jgi:outer membrane protein assembly factor BamD (BamD/ComL family)
MRARIARAAAAHEMAVAAELYARLLELDPQTVLPEALQLEVANELMSHGYHPTAARAYELFLQSYPRYPQRHQVELILGLIHARYLKNPARARELLAQAAEHLQDPDQQRLAHEVLQELAH